MNQPTGVRERLSKYATPQAESRRAWSEVALGEISDCIDYGHTASSSRAKVGPKFLRITDIQDGTVSWDDVPFCECTDQERKKYALSQGDIVFARTGATTGKSFLIRDCPEGAVFASYLIRVRPSDRIYPGFLARFFDTPLYWQQITSSSNGSTQPGVNSTKLKQLTLPLPPLPDQRRIAGILDAADAIRRKRQQTIGLTEQFLRSTFLDMFGDPVTNPRGWETRKLKSLIKDGDKINYGIVQPGDECPGGVPIIRVGDFKNLKISLSELKRVAPQVDERHKKSRLVGDEILLACVGSIGAIALAEPKLAGFNIVRAVARIRCNDDVNRRYLAALLATPRMQGYFTSETRTVAQPTLNIKQIESTDILLPPMQLQQKFAGIVDQIFATTTRFAGATGQNENLFNSLVQRAFRGEL